MDYDQNNELHFEQMMTDFPGMSLPLHFEDMRPAMYEQVYTPQSLDESQWPSPIQSSPSTPIIGSAVPRTKSARTSHPSEYAMKAESAAVDGVSKDRRRKKNRQAQAAFRERQKKVIADLRQDLVHHVHYNRLLKKKMYDMLGGMKAVRVEVEEVLALEPPLISVDYLRTGILEVRTSPAPSSEASRE
ncbi:uncharacterized protein RSE6_10756 [Rhynchosporium secalis]|uniref:BZIP domain-containing protein n=1 Tax=Rhynchosporium secalis TaxID=38038 RepID=A0A1E1ML93_RHYSE|nr:uncharacterized protein RSE6_10756 [Rhynchosporium secalis]